MVVEQVLDCVERLGEERARFNLGHRATGQHDHGDSAAAHGLSRWVNAPFVIKDYHEHTLGERSDSRSVAYIRCLFQDGSSRWGVGIDSDVARASLQALFNAVSRS